MAFDESKIKRDNRGRFATKGGGAKASEGESLDLFHGTAQSSIQAIIDNGFKAGHSPSDFGLAVYFKSPKFDGIEADSDTVTSRVVNDFSKRASKSGGVSVNDNRGVVQVKIPAENILDCTKGRPQELEDLMQTYHTGSKEELFETFYRTLFDEDISGQDFDKVVEQTASRSEEIQSRMQGHLSRPPKHDGGSGYSDLIEWLSPYEVYCAKHGYKAVIDVLEGYEDEGWQIGVYDLDLLNIVDTGRIMGDNAELVKSQSKGGAFYKLRHMEFDEGGNLYMELDLNDDREEIAKSIASFRALTEEWQNEK